MRTSQCVVDALLMVVYSVLIVFGIINVNNFLIKQGRYKNYFVLSFYVTSLLCLFSRLIDWGLFFSFFVFSDPLIEI